MEKQFELNIVTAGNINLKEYVVSMITMSNDGEIEILSNFNDSIISTVSAKTTFVNIKGEKKSFLTSDGIIFVKNNIVNFCCGSVEAIWSVGLDNVQSFFIFKNCLLLRFFVEMEHFEDLINILLYIE